MIFKKKSIVYFQSNTLYDLIGLIFFHSYHWIQVGCLSVCLFLIQQKAIYFRRGWKIGVFQGLGGVGLATQQIDPRWFPKANTSFSHHWSIDSTQPPLPNFTAIALVCVVCVWLGESLWLLEFRKCPTEQSSFENKK